MINTNYNNYSLNKTNIISFEGKKNKNKKDTGKQILKDLDDDIFTNGNLKEHGYHELKKRQSRIKKFINEIMIPHLEKSDLTCKELAEQFKEILHRV